MLALLALLVGDGLVWLCIDRAGEGEEGVVVFVAVSVPHEALNS